MERQGKASLINQPVFMNCKLHIGICHSDEKWMKGRKVDGNVQNWKWRKRKGRMRSLDNSYRSLVAKNRKNMSVFEKRHRDRLLCNLLIWEKFKYLNMGELNSTADGSSSWRQEDWGCWHIIGRWLLKGQSSGEIHQNSDEGIIFR